MPPDSAAPKTEILREPEWDLARRLPRLVLVVVDGPDRGRQAAPDRAVVVVGTSPEADLALTDPTVSRYHCELTLAGDRVRVVDTGSANGTFSGGIRLAQAEVPVGTLLRLGRSTVRVSTAEETVEVPLSSRDRFGGLLGGSACMREVFAILERVAPTDTTVLLEGESGTGKELAAEALHAMSARAEGPFAVFDGGAVPHDLVESALFGHVRGAFTGAVAERRGVFEEAHGGTLFLDEIGELPLELQPKLLRVLEKREVRPVGADTTVGVDVRIVAATNRPLDAAVNAGRFREDLYYRLSVVRVRLPPLRERLEDVPMLVEHFLRDLTPGVADPPGLSEGQRTALASRPWPGNVRQLRNAVERIVSLAGAGTRLGSAPRSPERKEVSGSDLDGPFGPARERLIASFERRYFEQSLRRCRGNVSLVARTAGVSRTLVQRMMKRHRLRSES